MPAIAVRIDTGTLSTYSTIVSDYRAAVSDPPGQLTSTCMRLPNSKTDDALIIGFLMQRYIEKGELNMGDAILIDDESTRSIRVFYKRLRTQLKRIYTRQATERNRHKTCSLRKPFGTTLFHSARYNREAYIKAKELPLSDQIINPKAMIVDISDAEELRDFFNRLSMNTSATCTKRDSIGEYEEFNRGAFYVDGRMDLCKQVVGSTHIDALMQSIRLNPYVTHFLLGNNIIGPYGAKCIADFIQDSGTLAKIQTWYLAGNDIDADGVSKIAEALSTDTHCRNLWLKRNPLGTVGAKAIAEMLETNTTIQVIDLHNTAIFDDGCITLFNSLKHNSTLKSLYLDANGLTKRSAIAIADYFNYHPSIQYLSIGMNRFGDTGIQIICQGIIAAINMGWNIPLKTLVIGGNRIENCETLEIIFETALKCPHLEFLDIGAYKSIADMGELVNYFKGGGVIVADFIRRNTHVKCLNIDDCHFTDEDHNNIKEALTLDGPLKWIVLNHMCRDVHTLINPDCMDNNDPVRDKIRKLKHGSDIWVIDSIYRNAM